MLDQEVHEYCAGCGQKIEVSDEQVEAMLAEQNRQEREDRVWKRLRRMLTGSVMLLIVLIGLKIATTVVPHEEVNAYLPPPQVDLAVMEKLPIELTKLPMPFEQGRFTATVNENDLEIARKLRKAAFEQAPAYTHGDKVYKGFVVKRTPPAEILTIDKKVTVPVSVIKQE